MSLSIEKWRARLVNRGSLVAGSVPVPTAQKADLITAKTYFPSTHNTSISLVSSHDLFAGSIFDSGKYENIFRIINSDDFKNIILDDSANELERELNKILKGKPSEVKNKITPEIFNNLYDPTLPTFGLFYPECIHGSSIVGMANQRQKERNCNVVILPHFPSEGYLFEERSGRWLLTAGSGIFIGKEKEIYYGKFPYSIEIDLISLEDVVSYTIDFCEEHGIRTLNHSSILQSCADKTDSLEKLYRAGLPVPEFIVIREINEDNIQHIKDFVLKNRGKVVIKPHNQSQGDGVKIFNEINFNVAINHSSELIKKYGCAIVQKRAESCPFYKENIRQDWNVRAIVSSKGLVDIAIRAGEFGEHPINGTKGADCLPMDHVFNLLYLSPLRKTEMRSEIYKVIENVCVKGREVLGGGDYLGFDLIIDKNLNPWIIEVNAGLVGGLTYISEVRFGENRFKTATKLLEKVDIRKIPNEGFPNLYQPAIKFENHHIRFMMLKLFAYLAKSNLGAENKADILKEIRNLFKEKRNSVKSEVDARYILTRVIKDFLSLENKSEAAITLELYKEFIGEDSFYKSAIALV